MADTIKVELTTDAIENGDYEALLDQVDSIANDGIEPGQSKTVTIELTIKNEETE
jgi:hypothetical protein